MSKISISDIAKHAGVSITTVSFVLNGKAEEKRISKPVTEKVLRIVEELGFKPNQIARSLRTGKSQTIGLIVEDISNVFFAGVAKGIEDQAYKQGYKVIYCSTENNAKKGIDLINMLQKRQVDGYIIVPSVGLDDDIKSLQEDGKPVVLFDRYLNAVNSSYVIVDNYQGSYSAIAHLIGGGRKNIAMVTIVSDQMQMLEREKGYKQALTDNGIPVNENLITRIRFDEANDCALKEITKLLTEHKVDAIFFATNYLSIAGLECIKALDLKIPTDIAMISYDDHDLFRLHTPSISVIAQPIADISSNIIKILLKQLKSSTSSEPVQVVLPTSLIIRDSSK